MTHHPPAYSPLGLPWWQASTLYYGAGICGQTTLLETTQATRLNRNEQTNDGRKSHNPPFPTFIPKFVTTSGFGTHTESHNPPFPTSGFGTHTERRFSSSFFLTFSFMPHLLRNCEHYCFDCKHVTNETSRSENHIESAYQQQTTLKMRGVPSGYKIFFERI